MTCPACGREGELGVVCMGCGKVLHESGRLPAGFMVADRYEVRRYLGEGGMGTVYEAYDRKLEERVALKLLKADFTHSQEMERRFRHEIKLARRLRHPNVCAIHEYGDAGPLRYITLELIEGVDLKRRLREKGALAVAEGFRIALQIAQGLDCIHRAGVVHRDLKASNVMLDRNGDVRLMDFGIAKQIGPEATLGATAVGSIIGTPEYMSPEQGRGETLDYRSDIYSLGIVIYEIFTGDVPFRGDTPIATIVKTMQEPLDLDKPQAQGIPMALRPPLLKALAKRATDRFASAEEMAVALAVARDATLGAGGTWPLPETIIERPTATLATAHTPTPVPPAPPTVVSTPRAAPRPYAPPAASQPQRPSPRPAERSALPFVLGLAAVVLLGAAGGALVYFWPEPNPVPSPTAAADGADGIPETSPSLEPREPVQPGDLSRSAEPEPTASATPMPVPTAAVSFVRATPLPATTPLPISSTPAAIAPTPTPRAVTTPTAPAAPGQLLLYVKPWALVTVDGEDKGSTPLKPFELVAGTHQVVLKHPAYEPLSRRVTIEPGKTTRLEINLPAEGQRLP